MGKAKIAPLYVELLILFLIIGTYAGVKIYQYNSWIHTIGEVHKVEGETLITIRGNIRNEVPIIRYLAGNRIYEMKATLLTGFSELESGEQLTVIYPADKPENGSVLNILGFWLPIPAFILILFSFLIGIGIFRIVSS